MSYFTWEQRRPTKRRFDAEADAKWAAFRGGLTRADRTDLLIRDADAEWPGAFGARRVFALGGGSEDEPFGSGWEPLDPSDAEQIWSEVEAERASDDPRELLSRVARAWGAELKAVDLGHGLTRAVNPQRKRLPCLRKFPFHSRRKGS